MRSPMLQRLCSSYASGLATAEKLLAGRSLDDEELELELGDEGLSGSTRQFLRHECLEADRLRSFPFAVAIAIIGNA